MIGNVLGLAYRGLAKLLWVDLFAAHERREYVSLEYARTHPEEVSWDEDEDEDEDEDRPFILVPTRPNYRKRLLAPLGQAAQRLSQLRLRWQQRQLADLLVRNITIADQPQLADGTAPLPADLFAPTSIEAFSNFNTCLAGHEIEIEVHNKNRRECRLIMALVGISEDDRGAAP